MTAFVSTEITVANTTAVKAVDSEAFNRLVTIHDPAGGLRVAFTSASASTGMKVARMIPSTTQAVATFALPAGQELWVWQDSGNTASVPVFVTVN